MSRKVTIMPVKPMTKVANMPAESWIVIRCWAAINSRSAWNSALISARRVLCAKLKGCGKPVWRKRHWLGSGEPARKKNQSVSATAASITELISTASTTVTEPCTGVVSRMLRSQLGRIGPSRLVPVMRT